MAERAWEVKKGMTADKDHKDRENTIGFEGSGLTSDKYVRVASQWFDHDGSPLPE
ncbi:MAG: hypothetical protein GY839_20525, partial [candidate division Zixibacteria bacterium]|nr:hypothetical protein [candidate division Zixibacteria bacterium]